MMDVSEEEFEAWRELPVTQWIFAAIEQATAAAKQQYLDTAWELGSANAEYLRELKTRHDAMRGLIDADYEAWRSYHDEERTGD